ncbi:hypothetical protein PH7735_02933 [Shimia thalassica]|uniref:Uncharacterized protein n=1 Tax=Shimia thalassica TaxID=1715693 RepID=A0A0P1ICQ9_9RHOB|nr:hypothetical protein [Shimia thalassica]CUK05674.1 hypothetical protein PH7735_02933 [Shimia thalassica]
MRFLLGVLSALLLLGIAGVAITVVQVFHREFVAFETASVPESKPIEMSEVETAEAPFAIDEVPLPLPVEETLDPEKVAQAHAVRNIELEKVIAPDAPLAEVSDREAVLAARFADAMRVATGDMPDKTARGGLIDFSSGSNSGGFENRMRDVYPAYYDTWDDLMRRCYDFVADHARVDGTDLTPKDERRIDYGAENSQQTWHSRDKAFTIKARVFGASSPRGVRRNCSVKSNRFALASTKAVGQLKGRFHDWWANSGNARATTAIEYPYTPHPKHKWYGGKTSFGSVQGCVLKVEVSEITIAQETDVTFFIVELEDNDCTAGSGSSGVRGVRVNRLPQVRN